MKDSERTMIEARRNLVRKMMSEGRSEDEIYTACRNLKYEPLKRIYTNEMILKRESKRTGKKAEYKSRYKEMRSLIQECANSSKSCELLRR